MLQGKCSQNPKHLVERVEKLSIDVKSTRVRRNGRLNRVKMPGAKKSKTPI